ncbi:MAG: universal stress protein [Deltaproteobacteria bacterium]|nr:universal stress protein [Deltaproteobacteria bacterium]
MTQDSQGRSSRRNEAPPDRPFKQIVACLDGSELGERAMPHALALAKALKAPITLLRVLEGRGMGEAPPDPLEWEIRRKEAREYLEQIAEDRAGKKSSIKANVEVIEGQAAEQICLWAEHHGVDLTVLCSHGLSGCTDWSLASTARKLAERAPGSLLLVPAATAPVDHIARYRRLLVPLDGSPLAESVLSLATRLAAAHGAELILAHAIAVPELTGTGPHDARDLELRDRLTQRNERVASAYLDRLRARVARNGIIPSVLVLPAGDVRTRLARLIADEGIDLVILSAHGQSSRSDVPCGNVTTYLMAHSLTPLLIVRPRAAQSTRRAHAPTEQSATRFPRQASL